MEKKEVNDEKKKKNEERKKNNWYKKMKRKSEKKWEFYFLFFSCENLHNAGRKISGKVFIHQQTFSHTYSTTPLQFSKGKNSCNLSTEQDNTSPHGNEVDGRIGRERRIRKWVG